MLIVCSFLQSLCCAVKDFTVRAVHMTKRLYRSYAVTMAGMFVVAVAAFTSGGISSGGKNALTAYAETPVQEETAKPEEEETSEELLNMAGGRMQLHLMDSEALREGQALAGNTLAREVFARQEAWKEQRAAVEEAKVETRRVEEARARQAEEEAKRASAVVSYTDQDYEVLKKIVEAEAGSCDLEGRILVANVIINRTRNREFPNTITDVVFQKSQFSPVHDGRINSCKVSEKTVEAVDRALAGEDYSRGALYFMNRRRSQARNVSWFDGRLTYLFEHGNHEFFR